MVPFYGAGPIHAASREGELIAWELLRLKLPSSSTVWNSCVVFEIASGNVHICCMCVCVYV